MKSLKRLLFLLLFIPYLLAGQTVLVVGDALGPELVVNGDFAVSTGWTFNDDWSYDAVNFEADYTDGVQSYFDRSITITAGITYQVSYTIKNYSAGTGYIWFTNQTGSGIFSVSWWTITANGVFTANYVALESATSLRIYAHTLSVNYSVDDISIKEVSNPFVLTDGTNVLISTDSIIFHAEGSDIPYVKFTAGKYSAITDSTGVVKLPRANFYSARRGGYENESGWVEIDRSDDTVSVTMTKLVFDDYYLPSNGELFFINNITDQAWMGFSSTSYWTSTENNATSAKRVNPVNQALGNNSKNSSLRARAVRSFQSSDVYAITDITLAGGMIYYIDEATDPDTYYEVFFTDFLNVTWSNVVDGLIGTTSVDVGEGLDNSNEIVGQVGHTASPAKTSLDLDYQPYYMPYQSNAIPLFSIIFDDGAEASYTDYFPLLTGLGVVGCAAVITDNIGGDGSVTFAQLLEMEAAGWEIMSHSKSHPHLPEEIEADIIEELSGSKAALEAEGITCNNFVYPFGDHSLSVRILTSEYYRSGREYALIGIDFEVNEDPFNMFHIRSSPGDIRREITNESDMDDVKALVDEAFTNNQWMTLTMHNYSEAKGTALAELINYVKNKGMDIVTVNEALDIIQ